VGELPPRWPPPCVQFRPQQQQQQQQPLLAPGALWRLYHAAWLFSLRSIPNLIAQGQLGRFMRTGSKKTKNRRKKGDDAGNLVRLPRMLLHQLTIFKYLPFGLLHRFCGVLARSSNSAGSSSLLYLHDDLLNA
jgi:hypothetical protein